MDTQADWFQSQKNWFLVCLAFMFIVATYSLTIPFMGAPDEHTHFFLVEYLYKFHQVPRAGIDPATPFTGELGGFGYDNKFFWYYGIPDLYAYGGAALALLWARFLPPHFGFLAVRSFNWLLAPMFMYAISCVAYYCNLRRSVLWLVVLTFCAIPQITFIFSYFNSDALALTSTAVALALCLKYIRFRKVSCGVALGLALGIVACTKVYFFPALLYIAVIIVFAVLGSGLDFRGQLNFLLVPVAFFLFVAFPINYATYRFFGDFTGMTGQYKFRDFILNEGSAVSMCFVMCKDHILDTSNLYWWITFAFESFFAVLGWMNVYVPGLYYTGFFLPLVVVILAANMWISVSRWRTARLTKWSRQWPMVNFVLFWGMTVAVVISNIYGSQKLIPQPQGRYLFVIVPFLVIQVATMLESFVAKDAVDPARQAEAGA